jgi:hypothetical protein
MRIAVVLAALLLCSGCFVSDELDQGMEILDKHGSKGTQKTAQAKKGKAPAADEAPAPATPAKKEPGMLEELTKWASKKLEGPPPPPDPGDTPVRCFAGGREYFSSRSDCEAKRGRVVELPPRKN